MTARKSPGDRLRVLAGGELRTSQRGDAIIGHRLPNGQLHVHSPGEPCTLCDRAKSLPS